MNPHEPHQDPDWEGIFARLDGAPTPDEIAEAKRQGAEAMLDALVACALPKSQKAWAGAAKHGLARTLGIRLLALLHLRRHPAMHHVCSKTHLAALVGCNANELSAIVGRVCVDLGVPKQVEKGHKWRPKK